MIEDQMIPIEYEDYQCVEHDSRGGNDVETTGGNQDSNYVD